MIHRNPTYIIRYMGPTNTRGARVAARQPGGHTTTRPWDYEASWSENAIAAAEAAYRNDAPGLAEMPHDWNLSPSHNTTFLATPLLGLTTNPETNA